MAEVQPFKYIEVHLFPEEQIGLHEQDLWELIYIRQGQGTRIIADKVSPFKAEKWQSFLPIPPIVINSTTKTPTVKARFVISVRSSLQISCDVVQTHSLNSKNVSQPSCSEMPPSSSRKS